MSAYRSGFLHRLPVDIKIESTDDIPEGLDNLYFTEPHVLATLLTGYVPGVPTLINSGNTILEALQSLQAQINLLQALIYVDYYLITSVALTFVDDGLITAAATTMEDWDTIVS